MPTPAADERPVAFQVEGPNGLEAPTLLATMGPYSYNSPAVKFYMDYVVRQSPTNNYSVIDLTIRAYNDSSATSSSGYFNSGTHRGSVDGIDSDVVTHAANPFLPSGYAANALRWSEKKTSVQIEHDSNGAHANVKVRMLIRYGSIDDEFTATVSLPTMAGKPNKINSVNTTNQTTNSFVVSHGVPDDNGAAITGYDVQWDQSSDFSSPATKSYGDSPNPSVTITGLGDAARYYVRVRATNSVGDAPWSTDGEFQETIPAPPGDVSVGTPTTSSLTVKWAAPGPVVSGYEVDYSTSSTFASGVTTVQLGNVLTTKISGLADATRYYFRVRAKNAGGTSLNSVTVNAETTPGVPSGITVTVPTISSLRASWVAPGPNVTTYDIQYDTDPNFGSPVTKSDTASPYDIIDLDDGTLYYVRVRANNSSTTPGAYSAPGVAAYTVPRQPTSLTLSEPTTLSIRATWVAPGPNITGYELDYSTSSTFASGVTTIQLGNVLTTVIPTLTPGTTYYVRVRAKNPGGTSVNSTATSQATLPSVGPGFSVSSSASGTSANLAFSPPGGVSGVTKYDWEERVRGTTTPEKTGSTTTTSAVVSGLTPGSTYEWRASAWIGPDYQSPWTNWLVVTQEKPNTTPGEYFDGSTKDTVDLDYQWTGTVDASTSIAVASGVEGWELTNATGVLYRITGGLLSEHAARAQINVDLVGAGARVGQKTEALYRSAVIENQVYVGSMHVSPSRGQNLAAELTWLNDQGGVMSRTVGAPSVVPGAQWARLTTGGLAPVGAKFAVVNVIDVTGTGWSLWHGGEYLDVDAAMISLHELFPYFDGATKFDGNYVYEWTGIANASTSKRTEFALAQPGALEMDLLQGPSLPSELALIDPDCDVPPKPPRPPVVDNICLVDSTQWHRFYYKIPAKKVAEWMDMVPTLYVTNTSTKAAKEARIRYYENPKDLPAADVIKTDWVAEQIISYLPGSTRFALDGITQRVWAAVDGAKAVHADHLLYGTGGKPPTWPVLSCGIAYLVSVETPLASPQTQVDVKASLTART